MWQALLEQAVRMTERVTNRKTLFLNSKGAEKNTLWHHQNTIIVNIL